MSASSAAIDDDFPKSGLKLSFLEEFYEACGGKEALSGLTTTDVCTQFVKPQTLAMKCSYCEMLRNDNHPAVDIATVFISHAWKYLFLDVMEALTHHFRDEPDTIVWFDLFTNNQHKATNYPFEWWSNTFKSAISEFGHTVMIFAPWNDPIPLKRAWCLFELYCTTITNSKFEIAMSLSQQETFLQDMKSDKESIKNMLAIVDAENSECHFLADRDRIFGVVRDSVGFDGVNSMVFSKLREWVISVASDALTHETAGDIAAASLQSVLANLHSGQGNYDKAEPLQINCLETRRVKLGDDHPDTLKTMINLGNVYYDQGKFNQAEALYLDCLETRRLKLGCDHFDTLSSMNNLANAYSDQGKYDQAEALYLDCLEMRRVKLGDNHPDTLSSMNNLANVYSDQGKYDQAEALHIDHLEKRRVKLGNDHPDTLQSMNNLATVYAKQGKYDQAEALHIDCLVKKISKLGDDHPATLTAMNNLASVYGRQGKYDQAEALYLDCLEKRRVKLGDDHPYTLTSKNNLASVYYRQGKYDLAKALHLDCLEKRRVKLGDDHPDILASLNNVASVYYRQGKYELAEALYLDCLEKRRVKLGNDHPQTLSSLNSLVEIYSKQRKYDQAEALRSCIGK